MRAYLEQDLLPVLLLEDQLIKTSLLIADDVVSHAHANRREKFHEAILGSVLDDKLDEPVDDRLVYLRLEKDLVTGNELVESNGRSDGVGDLVSNPGTYPAWLTRKIQLGGAVAPEKHRESMPCEPDHVGD